MLSAGASVNAQQMREKIGARRVVASISGGKDSAAMSLLLTELGIEHDRVFADTGWEAQETYDYLRDVLPKVLGPITWVRGTSMEQLCMDKGMFPSRKYRFCTQELKVFPLRDHMVRVLEEHPAGIVNAVGIRAAESEARSKFTEWEPFPPGMPPEVETWRPILRWTVDDVVAIHKRHGLAPNPLYLKGASRVGCWPCIFARKGEIAMIAEKDPARIDAIRVLEQRVQDAAAARYAAKGETFESLGYGRPTFFQSRVEDATGSRPLTPIDDIVAWATAKSDVERDQLTMFGDAEVDAALEGCMRWGMCETHENKDEKP